MSIDTASFIRLCEKINTSVDLFGDAPPAPPWGNNLDPNLVLKAINSGANSLPIAYQTGYVTPLTDNLATIVARTPDEVEPLAGAVYEHAPGSIVKAELGRFLAVISNLYRSFLSNEKRAAANIPAAMPQNPPLATFLHSGMSGPFTIPSDDIGQLFGSNIGVVCLPATYRAHPLLWASLAHETGGHDVTHADTGLLPELGAGARALFGGGLPAGRSLTEEQFLGILWSYWIDEASADVYGLLNIGPAFALNLAAFFAAMNTQAGHAPIPTLRTQSGHPQGDPAMDVHPTDLLRLHLAIGVIESLTGLADATKADYVASLTALATLCAQGATTIDFQGDIAIDRDHWVTVNASRPLAEMQDAARRAGAYIATARLQSLDNHSIQEIETWDDSDEATARQIAAAMARNSSVAEMGDDAQLLAGATLALLAQPDLYDQVTGLLAAALDRSFQQDPIFGTPSAGPAYVRYAAIAPRRAASPV